MASEILPDRFSRWPIRTASPKIAAAEVAFLLANGRGGMVDPASPLAREPFLVVAELTGAAAASRIVLAAPITLAEIEARFAGQIEDREAITLRHGLRLAARAAKPEAGRA